MDVRGNDGEEEEDAVDDHVGFWTAEEEDGEGWDWTIREKVKSEISCCSPIAIDGRVRKDMEIPRALLTEDIDQRDNESLEHFGFISRRCSPIGEYP